MNPERIWEMYVKMFPALSRNARTFYRKSTNTIEIQNRDRTKLSFTYRTPLNWELKGVTK